MDLVIGNNAAQDVSIVLGNPDGSFQAARSYSTGGNADDLVIGDFDKDGNLDIAVAHFTTSSIGILLGNGDGTFRNGTNVATPDYTTSITTADFNHDGFLDLAVGVNGSNSVLIYPGTGTGSFGAPIALTAGTMPIRYVRAGHFNNDGNADLAVIGTSGYNGELNVLLGSGNFGFTKTFTMSATDPRYLNAADVNQDGYSDLLYSEGFCPAGFCPAVHVLISQKNGQFTQSAKITLDGSSHKIPFTPQAIDVNGDGINDIAFAIYGAEAVSNGSTSTYEVLVYLGNPDGTYQSVPAKIWTGTNKSTSAITVGDFNRDGKLDIATANPGDATMSVLLNTTPRGACKLSTTSPSITVCQPQDNTAALVDANHSIRFTGCTTDASTVNVVKLYMDNALIFSQAGNCLNTDVVPNPGIHFFVIKAWDRAGNIFRTNRHLTAYNGPYGQTCTVAPLSAKICSPAPGSSNASPVRVVGGINSDRPVTSTQLYVDNALIYSTKTSDHVDRSFTLSSGSHYMVLKGWDASGRIFSTSRSFTVQ